jgi:hypothetical protein
VPGLNDPKSTSGKNPVDVVVSSGNPSGMQNPSSYPPTGSFEFATDAIWYGKPYVDLAYVSIDQNCIVLQPDMNRLTYAEKQVINTFSGLGATHVIYEGYIKICSNDGFNTVNGYIDMNGYNAMTPYTQTTKTARYTASFQGRMYGSAELGL